MAVVKGHKDFLICGFLNRKKIIWKKYLAKTEKISLMNRMKKIELK